VILPFPTSWTEAPEIWKNLGKQRNRWYRGLLEVLWLHRSMMFRPRYGIIGLFSLPYQLLFEALAPIIEVVGYVMIPLSIFSRILSPAAMASFVALALAFSLLLSTGSMLLAVWRVRVRGRREPLALLGYRGFRTTAIMVLTGILCNLGYRQYLIYWQLRGLRDFLAGRKSWDKFARAGFQQQGPPAQPQPPAQPGKPPGEVGQRPTPGG
jgi:cellulose synthase/poly-beta-1,6-N-acetylglucosamine synthase-like glycosyltransferase